MIKASRPSIKSKNEEDDINMDDAASTADQDTVAADEFNDDEDDDDPAPKPKAKPKKVKKIVPVGRNGLKKRRVMKSKTDFDAKGYMGALLPPLFELTSYTDDLAHLSDGRLFFI